ncbi:tyrosine-type recombinase/integrase [Anaerorhabdus furcosa]|uniref:Site-specific recombinase XerD n=1 Tax=Anaerorhabdus furcosa TaxID=118967 RepID=A0A1T4LI97_9FIRM|nr:tyrosine-type recombinase/integrase [Anaerorhabdus furcosa]SJZ54104.1 Site-specific recombinase XerD [Anaerorhabdus furcosa]
MKWNCIEYSQFLTENERSELTIKKYCADIEKYIKFITERNEYITKENVILFKRSLLGLYAVSSANSIIIAVNGYLKFIGLSDYCVRVYKLQRSIFMDDTKSFDKNDYYKLIEKSKKDKNEKITEILYTFASTGIRVSELRYITVESLNRGKVQVNLKGKIRVIILTNNLVKRLRVYCKKFNILKGSIFVTRNGRNIDRSNLWRSLKKLAKEGGVACSKVFPHNFRHLFAKIYYEKQRDIVRLADFLGHSSLETTRLYTSTGNINECRVMLDAIFKFRE